ncbi:MAG: SMP-30/gluconolactonase/LRE family protein [Verrucomicrobiota bacterium]|nr:SMP-30/gluconolactonase/LRE family protein [Verrucomicrobiota bacterium]
MNLSITLSVLLCASVTLFSEEAMATVETRKGKPEPKVYPTMGKIERLDPALRNLIPPFAEIEKLASGFEWSEGPVWDKKKKVLYFSDVPNNVVFRWQEGMRTAEYMNPSGYTGSTSRGGEPGSNGLTIDNQGRLVLCQHGDRQVARREQNGKVTPLARYYNFRRFNSPNDLVYKSNGDLYFTDPPYGLLKGNNDPAKELNFNGVYRVTPKGEVTLLTRELSFPNGIAFSPDEKILYVAISDPQNPVIMAYDVQKNGMIENGRVFFDTKHLMEGRKGLPDGLKVDKLGNLFATGPGGVLVITPAGQHLGTINTGEATANCGWGDDGSTLYITADMYLCRVKTSTKGKGF